MEILDLKGDKSAIPDGDEASRQAANKWGGLPSIDAPPKRNHRRGIQLSNRTAKVANVYEMGVTWVCIEYAKPNDAGVAYEAIAMEQWSQAAAWACVVMHADVESGAAPSFELLSKAMTDSDGLTAIYSINTALAVSVTAPCNEEEKKVYVLGSLCFGLICDAKKARRIQSDISGFLAWHNWTQGLLHKPSSALSSLFRSMRGKPMHRFPGDGEAAGGDEAHPPGAPRTR
jgi:hypothetical protein